MISQFSVSTTPYLQCVAVSQTGDPTGAYYRYAFTYGTSTSRTTRRWASGRTATTSPSTSSPTAPTFAGPKVCAFDRAQDADRRRAATQQCFNTGSDLRRPAARRPRRLDAAAGRRAELRRRASARPARRCASGSSTSTGRRRRTRRFTGPDARSRSPSFTQACGGGTCIPQPGTTRQLDSLADRLMYRLAYRNFGDHESLVVNHSVDRRAARPACAGTSCATRAATPTVFQQGTYAPDATYRWMGSVAMDQQRQHRARLQRLELEPRIRRSATPAGSPATRSAR